MWFDSHCHLNLPGFGSSSAEVWAEAHAGGVERVFVPGTDPGEWSDSLVGSLPGVCTGVGLHPFTLETWQRPLTQPLDECLALLAEEARRGQHVAIGECGWDKPLALRCPHLSLDLQTAIVEAHLQLAVELSLPIVLHVVQAHGLALEVLGRYRLPRGGVIHSFSGSAELVSSYCRQGFALGYGTQLLRPKPGKAMTALGATPRSRILLETDAPFRRHVPELPNSPLAVVNVANAVATGLGLSLEAVAELTYSNAVQLFRT